MEGKVRNRVHLCAESLRRMTAVGAALLMLLLLAGCDGSGGTSLVNGVILNSGNNDGIGGGGGDNNNVDTSDDNDQIPVDEQLDPFPPQNLSAAVLAIEAIGQAQLDDPDYYTNGQPNRDFLIAWSTTGLSATYYNLQGPLEGLIALYEATGYQRHFELALELCENMVAAANQDRNMDGHPEWDGSLNGVPPSDGKPDVFLYDMQASVGIARLARIILTTPRLEQHYGERGQALLDFVDNHIVDKWLYGYHQLIWIRALTNWSDKASMMTRILVDIHLATGSQTHRDLAAEFATLFTNTVLVYDANFDSYSWPTIGSPDTSHTNREAMFINACAEAGIVFTDTDVNRVANNLVFKMWNGSLADPRITNFHTGDNGQVPGSNRGPWEWGLIFDGWVATGRVNDSVQAVGTAIFNLTQTNPQINPTVDRSKSNNQVLAMGGNLARNLRLNGQ